jgi:hypothetical protein
MENFLVRKGPRWVAIAANLIVLVVYSIFVWGWYGGAGDLFILIGPLGLFALSYGIYKALAALVLTVKNLFQSKKSGKIESGIWIDLGLCLLPLLLVLAGVLWIISWTKTL